MFVVVGTTTVDLFIGGLDRIPTLRGDEFTTDSLALLPEPFTIVLGGNGANAAYVLATLGAACALCSPLGQDTLGNLVVDWLASRKVDLTGLRRDPSHATASTAVVLDRSMQRLSFHHPGGSSAF